MKVAFIAPEQYVESLSLLGFEVFSADTEKKAEEKIKELKGDDFGLIFVSGDIYFKETPGVVVLPGIVKKPKTGFLQEIVKDALGKEIKLK